MSEEVLKPVFIDAFDLDDAWFQCLSTILDNGHVYTITRGSYEGQKRLEFDFVSVRVRYGKLHFILYFRSWDLWGGFPSNLGGLQLVKQYMAEEIGIEDGEIIAVSKGLHLYDYVWDLAKLRTNKIKDLK